MRTTVAELMASSGVKFGTSGARGLAVDMTDRVCHAYTVGFLEYLRGRGEFRPGQEVAVGGDLRPSTERIRNAVLRGIADAGGEPVDCGLVPSPALAVYAFGRGIPSIMVTGSHIPDDRNGIKFNRPTGEILKADEAGMLAQVVEWPESRFTADGAFSGVAESEPARRESGVGPAYVARYLEAFPGRPLGGMRLGVYQHSAVGRDLLVEILTVLGAVVTPLGRSSTFIPVDTEAIRPEDVELARTWAAAGGYDALVSADGDSDRPLLSDERGEWLRGDVAGILCARALGADCVVTPVNSNTALEMGGGFAATRRTKIGSPYVAAALLESMAAGHRRVVGYEANGGFLVASDLALPGGGRLEALPTRDAAIVLVAVLTAARAQGRTMSELVATLPARFTASDRLQHFASARGEKVLRRFETGNAEEDRRRFTSAFGAWVGSPATAIDRTDGLRVTHANGEIVHLRPSGNAPEFRCYTETSSPGRSAELCALVLSAVEVLAPGP